ncbi:MAG: hypothetical protein B6I36_09190 [Desulfobacteraceae bacterium 4572_35.1]|nr:MAG: hypothetical protein B6I36_09190 [Desulfobacteraceae bacterium 4572_35.1]
MMNNDDPTVCVKTARVAVLTATSLAILKVITGITTGSMALLSSAADSLLDIFMSSGNLLALKQASKPADTDHPYGHGKFESAATLLQSLLIATSGLFIIYKSIQQLVIGSEQLQNLDAGIAIMALCTIASWLLSRHLKSIGIQTGSTALQADALHYATDVYSNLVLLIGLIGLKILNWNWIDPACMDDFLDVGLPAHEIQAIVSCIEEFANDNTGYHNLRTRRSGKYRMIDFHLTFCHCKTIQEAHTTAQQIEDLIKQRINNTDVTVHLEPTACKHCRKAKHCTRVENTKKLTSNHNS